MAESAAVRSVFVRNSLSPAPPPGPPPQTSAAAPADSLDGQPAPAATPAASAAPRGDAPATVEEALSVMRRYVRALAGAYSRGRDCREDLENVGLFAVARAFEMFRGDEGISFRGYAWRNARWQIIRALRGEIQETRARVSGDAPLAEDSEHTLFDALPARQRARETPGMGHLEARLRQAVPKLRGQQRVCIELLLEARPQTEIAALLGVSHQRVQQIVALALVNLRKRITHGFLVERLHQREDRIGLAALAASAGPADPPEDSSGSLASSWPTRGRMIPGHDYRGCFRRREMNGEATDGGEPRDPRR